MSSNYSTNLPSDIILDSGLLYAGGSGAGGLTGSTPIGVSRGGLSFNPGKEYRNVEFDGKRSPVGGLDRVVSFAPSIEGTMIEFPTGSLSRFDAAGTLVSGSTSVYTPLAAGTMLTTGQYVSNLRLVFQRGNGQYVQVRFPYALNTQYDIKGQDQNEAEISVKFEARLSGSNMDTAPYVVEYAGVISA